MVDHLHFIDATFQVKRNVGVLVIMSKMYPSAATAAAVHSRYGEAQSFDQSVCNEIATGRGRRLELG